MSRDADRDDDQVDVGVGRDRRGGAVIAFDPPFLAGLLGGFGTGGGESGELVAAGK